MLVNPHRRQERDALLLGISALVSQDSRIVAAWLFGSLGRGTADDFSDIDIWIVVADSGIDAVVESREAFVAQLETPLLVIDAPQNAPPGGGYLLTLFARPSGEQQVDWYWQGKSQAAVPGDALMFFEREAIPRALPPAAPSEPVPRLDSAQLDGVTRKINFFWAMLPITAKKVARGQLWDGLRMLMMLRNVVAETGDLLDAQESCAAALARPPAHRASGYFGLLMQLARGMEELMGIAELQGAAVPTNVVAQVYDTVKMLLALQQSPKRRLQPNP